MITSKFSLTPLLLICLIISIHLSNTTASSHYRKQKSAAYGSHDSSDQYGERRGDYGRPSDRDLRRDDYHNTGRRDARPHTDRRYDDTPYDRTRTDSGNEYYDTDRNRRDGLDRRPKDHRRDYATTNTYPQNPQLLNAKKERDMAELAEKKLSMIRGTKKYNKVLQKEAKCLVNYEIKKIHYSEAHLNRTGQRTHPETSEAKRRRREQKQDENLRAFNAALNATQNPDIQQYINTMKQKYVNKWDKKNVNVQGKIWNSSSSSSSSSISFKSGSSSHSSNSSSSSNSSKSNSHRRRPSLTGYDYGKPTNAYINQAHAPIAPNIRPASPKSRYRKSYRRRSSGRSSRHSNSYGSYSHSN